MRDASDGSSQGVFFVLPGPSRARGTVGRERLAILGSNGFPQEQSFTNFFMTIV